MQSIISLLTTALLLLQLVAANPNLPQSFKDTANSIAQSAVTQATEALKDPGAPVNTNLVIPQTAVNNPVTPSTGGVVLGVSICEPHPVLSNFKPTKEFVTDEDWGFNLKATFTTGCDLDKNTKWDFSATPNTYAGSMENHGTLEKNFAGGISGGSYWSLEGPEVVEGKPITYNKATFYVSGARISTTTTFTLKIGDFVATTSVEKR